MSHELAQSADGYTYAGRKPAWHRLGTIMQPGESLDEWQKRAFPWSLRAGAVSFVPRGVDNPAGAHPVTMPDGRAFPLQKWDDRVVVYRDDTGQPLSIVSDRYKLVQPRDVLEFFTDLCRDQGFELETAGALKDGRIYWALAHTGQTANVAGDEHRAYTMLATSCDGSLANTARLTDVRVVCWNTLSMAESARNGAVHRTRHTTDFNPDEFKRALGLIDFEKSWFAEMDTMQQLAEQPVSIVQAANFVVELAGNKEGRDTAACVLAPETTRPHAEKRVANDGGVSYVLNRTRLDLDQLKAEIAETTRKLAEKPAESKGIAHALVEAGGQSSRKLWRVTQFGAGQTTNAAQGSAYGLLNGATRWVDYERTSDDAKRMASAQFGEGQRRKQTARKLALELLPAAA